MFFLVCLTVTLVSRALFFLPFFQLLRWYLAQCLFSGLFDCYVGVSRTIFFLVCLTVTLVSRALFVLWFFFSYIT